jgi:acyl-CoA reductase-like NAD-dependent aldehyde dehydrogenase
MKFDSLTITRTRYGIDKDKLLGEISFENQYSKVSVKLSEEKAYKMLEIIADNMVEQAHEVGKLLVQDLRRPIAEIEGEVQ